MTGMKMKSLIDEVNEIERKIMKLFVHFYRLARHSANN
jgi:hypothetical protein